jgi:hypothetical protein
MSAAFQIDDEIDKLLVKFTEDLRVRLKKAVIRSEKLVLKQYIASQKETVRVSKTQSSEKSTPRVNQSEKVCKSKIKSSSNRDLPKSPKNVHRREQDYKYTSDSD